jgi:2-polyprenyl-6-methoxyphenol hydroxylase-like FAD-dependent oxidoreductase
MDTPAECLLRRSATTENAVTELAAPQTDAPEDVIDVTQTACCVVGGGPAGLMLSLLLARRGVSVTLLESHHDFDRDFRGDTIHPSTLEVLDQIGLADQLLQIPHGRMSVLRVQTSEGPLTLADLRRLRTRFPFVALLPQVQFLNFLAEQARQYPGFRLVLGANVQRLVQEGDEVRGVRYHDADGGWHEVRAPLTVAADGRFSKVRGLLGLEPVRSSPPMDVVWFRLPRRADDPHDAGAIYTHGGIFVVLLERATEWQVGYVIVKGSYQHLRAGGVETLRTNLVRLIPWLADRAETLQDWHQVSVLSVESSLLPQWYRPGVLLIGDAAHAMSPVGGVGINYAIQDAVETANLLAAPLKEGRAAVSDLEAVQRRRVRPTKAIQRFQGLLQQQIAAPALRGDKPFRPPLLMRLLLKLPFLRDLPGRMIAFGLRRVHVEG